MATWTGNDSQLGITRSSAALIRHFDNAGGMLDYIVPFASSSWFRVGGNNPQALVVGENNTAFGSDGQSVIAFDINTGAQQWNFQPGGFQGTALMAATAQGGIAAVRLADFQGELDASPTALLSFDSTGAATATPFLGGNSDLTYFDSNTLLAIAGAGQGEMLTASASLDSSTLWYASGNLQIQRASPPLKVAKITPDKGLVGTATNVTITGAGFNSKVTINAGQNISVSNMKVASPSRITATFTPTNSKSAGGDQPITLSLDGRTTKNSVNFFVQIPSNFSVASVVQDSDSADTACPAGNQGFFAIVNYQLVDQNGSLIQVAGLIPQEQFSVNGSPALSQFTPFATPQSTPTTGAFGDKPVGSCITVIQGRNLCVNVAQTFNILVPTAGSGAVVGYPITTQTTRRDCQQGIKVTVNPGSSFMLGTVN